MPANDPFAPLSRKKKIGYAVAGLTIVVVAGVMLGSMDGGYSLWELLRVACVVGIPILGIVAVMAWLSGGRRTEAGVGPANVKFPIRFLKAIPYMAGIIALFYVLKAIEVFRSR